MRTQTHAIRIVGFAACMAIVSAPAMAGKDFDSDDLKGDFYCNVDVVSARPNADPPTLHCSRAMKARFDGLGTILLTGTERCGESGATSEFSVTRYYAVSPDGSVLWSGSPDLSDPNHGQLVDHGRALLLDSSTRTNPTLLGWSGVCMRP